MAMANDSTRSSAMSDVFYSPFHISSAIQIGYSQSDPRSHCLRVFAPFDAISTFCLVCQEDSNAPNKLNNDVRLITRFPVQLCRLSVPMIRA